MPLSPRPITEFTKVYIFKQYCIRISKCPPSDAKQSMHFWNQGPAWWVCLLTNRRIEDYVDDAGRYEGIAVTEDESWKCAMHRGNTSE